MRRLMASAALVALAACGTSIPESGPNIGAGVGFGDYDEYQARREAELAGNPIPAPAVVSTTTLGGDTSEGAQIAAAARAALDADDQTEERAANSGERIVQASPDNAAPAMVSGAGASVENSVGISVENSFEVVESQRSIESDAARIAASRQQYQVATVEALPSRTGGQGPNIVAYALMTKHPVGTQVYRRAGVNKNERYARNCAKYTGPDLAQIDFLEKGGPERDRLGLDPDGDGYACGWDPRPFRKARGG